MICRYQSTGKRGRGDETPSRARYIRLHFIDDPLCESTMVVVAGADDTVGEHLDVCAVSIGRMELLSIRKLVNVA